MEDYCTGDTSQHLDTVLLLISVATAAFLSRYLSRFGNDILLLLLLLRLPPVCPRLGRRRRRRQRARNGVAQQPLAAGPAGVLPLLRGGPELRREALAEDEDALLPEVQQGGQVARGVVGRYHWSMGIQSSTQPVSTYHSTVPGKAVR